MPVTVVAQTLRLLFAPLLASIVFAGRVASNVLASAVLLERAAVPLLLALYVLAVHMVGLYTDGRVSPASLVQGFVGRGRLRFSAPKCKYPDRTCQGFIQTM